MRQPTLPVILSLRGRQTRPSAWDRRPMVLRQQVCFRRVFDTTEVHWPMNKLREWMAEVLKFFQECLDAEPAQFEMWRRLPRAPSLSLTGVRLVIPDHALGSPVLRSLSLCTCCHHYPGSAAGRTASLIHPAVSAFPERVTGSACASAFSRLAQRSLTLRPAHSRRHQ